jgi:uncharacterized damage-inducible protein DinB
MFRYVAWADRKVLESLRAAPAAQAECLPLLAHMLAAEHVWLSRLDGREPRHAVWPTLGLEACEALAAENEAGYRSYLERLGDEQLSEMVHYRSSQGQEFGTPVIDILTQVITHGPYHRGQVAKALGRAGAAAVGTDFIFFARETESG